MKLICKKGETSKIMQVFIQDSSVTTGAGLTGLVHNTANLTAYYIREGSASPTVINLVTATVGTYISSGFKEVDSTNMPGVYELDLPNACLASGAEQVIVFLKGATNMAPLPIEIQLRDNTEKDIYDKVPTVGEIADQVWDEILTGATHNSPTSAGRRVREIGAFAIHSGTAQAGNSHSITLAATASADNGIYNRNLIVLVDNTGVGQTRTIVDYNATTKICVIDREWRVSPDNTTTYQIIPDDTPLTVDHGLVRGGTSNTVTIREYAASVDDSYLCNIITIIAGAGRGQARLVGSYDGTTKVVTICGDNWVTTPDTTSVYVMMPYGVTCASCIGNTALTEISDSVWDEQTSGHTISGSFGKSISFIEKIVGWLRSLL